MIKGMILDYGGTIDSPGIHWSKILREGWLKALSTEGLPQGWLDDESWNDAYVHTERLLGSTAYIKPNFDFLDTLLTKTALQLQCLQSTSTLWKDLSQLQARTIAQNAAKFCYRQAKEQIDINRATLDALSQLYPMALVSNFYGNLHAVLQDFMIEHYFQHVIESAAVGIRKPDTAIFTLAIDALKLNPEEIIVVGDSIKNDILPASALGCRCVWLNGEPTESKKAALPNNVIEIVTFEQLPKLIF